MSTVLLFPRYTAPVPPPPPPVPIQTAVFPLIGYHGAVNLHWGQAIGIGASDLFGAYASQVVAIRAGRVIDSSWNSIGGESVYLIFDNGLHCYVAHGIRGSRSVRTGQTVAAGAHLMQLGDSGNADVAPGHGDAHTHTGIGYSILDGGGVLGGSGTGFNAVGYLRSLLGARALSAAAARDEGTRRHCDVRHDLSRVYARLARMAAQRGGLHPPVDPALAEELVPFNVD